MLTVTVKTSLRYISTGLSEPFSPTPKAADGVAGVRIASTPSAAFGIGEKGSENPVEMYLNDVFTVTVNMAGLPGLVAPAGLSSDGLPLGLQLIGRPFDEETLFALGETIEQSAGRMTLPEPWWA